MTGGAAIKALFGPRWTTWARTVTRGLKRGFVPLTSDVEDYWHASADGWKVIIGQSWPDCDASVDTYGNCLAAAAAMYGVSVEELTPAELDVADPRYPVLVAIDCRVAE